MKQTALITIQNCRIENSKKIIIPNLNWTMNQGERWLIIGPNGGGKADFINALAGNLNLLPNPDTNQQISLYSNKFANCTDIVSLERAAQIIQEEHENDESEYIEGGVDIGRTGRIFITEGIVGKIKKGAPLPPEAASLDTNPAVQLTGVQHILDRGLKYMSTGEIRRTLLTRVLLSGKQLLILSDPFAGLDAESRKILFDFFTNMSQDGTDTKPNVILGMERWHEIPDTITHVLEFQNKEISFCGPRSDYETLLEDRKNSANTDQAAIKNQMQQVLNEAATTNTADQQSNQSLETPLVEMNNVNVGWDGHTVLKDLTWKLYKGQHWLIRGPNGSGKTTFLELITGDNKQVYCNDVRLFGQRRGTGESIWDIKKKLGIVSYRMHVEYRMLGGSSLREVIISGFRDSIGLYGEAPSDMEIAAANKWLALGGFENRGSESFGNISYGEQRAILILRSVVKTPEILILDEPCHGLDEQYRQKILQLMNIIGEQGITTMLHVTHDPTEVLDCEKHILSLHPGETPMYSIEVK